LTKNFFSLKIKIFI